MKIALVGMPNTGKTYWSKKLEESGFKRFGCDDLIEAKLDLNGIGSVTEWMGQPFTPGYRITSRKYLELEKYAMKEIFLNLEKYQNKNIVIDTTGSVIYLGNTILNTLKQQVKIIYFETPEAVTNEICERFIKYPKPVIWGNSFRKKRGESGQEALNRCFLQLLSFRTKSYKKIADVSINFFRLREKLYTTEQFLNDIV
jgi:shikimate kinase